MLVLSIKQLLEQARLQLTASDSPLLDVQVLLAHVLDVDRSYFYTWPEKELAAPLVAQFQVLVERRQLGEPVAYLVGKQEFWSLALSVSAATLIPRPETELLVELVLDNVTATKAVGIDLGTGTGAIALARASEQPNWQLLGVDFSEPAVMLANKNKQQLAIANAEFIQSSWLSSVGRQYRHSCDFIVSNPPYIDSNDPHLQLGDVRFEPKSALVAANNGLQDIIDITEQSCDYLKPDGLLLFEHGFEQGPAVRQILTDCGFVGVVTDRDLAGLDRVTSGRRPS